MISSKDMSCSEYPEATFGRKKRIKYKYPNVLTISHAYIGYFLR